MLGSLGTGKCLHDGKVAHTNSGQKVAPGITVGIIRCQLRHLAVVRESNGSTESEWEQVNMKVCV